MNRQNIFPMPSLALNPELRGSAPLVREYHEDSITIAIDAGEGVTTGTGHVHPVTELGEVLGVENVSLKTATQKIDLRCTGAITVANGVGSVQMNAVTDGVDAGALVVRYFLIGRLLPKSTTY